MKIVLIIIIIVSIIAHAKANAVIYHNKKVSHTWEAIMLLCIMLVIVFGNWTCVVSYILLRAGLFAPIYAMLIGQEYTFVGTTLWYDRILNYLVKLENKKDIPIIKGFPAYSIYLFLMVFFGLFFPFL